MLTNTGVRQCRDSHYSSTPFITYLVTSVATTPVFRIWCYQYLSKHSDVVMIKTDVVTMSGATNWFPAFTLNILRPRHNGRIFEYDIFKCIFWYEMWGFSIKIFTEIFFKCPSENIPPRVQMMAWHLTGEQAIIWTNDVLDYWRIYRSICLDESTHNVI